MGIAYLTGFGNNLSSEALPDTLPKGQNSPQRPARGLYAEQLSGSAFTAPRASNLRSWLYRIRPSVVQGEFTPCTDNPYWHDAPFSEQPTPPTQMRWDPQPYPKKPTDFIQGLISQAGCGGGVQVQGGGALLYTCNQSMTHRFFYNADAEMLLVPQEGGLRLATEFGLIEVSPGEIAVIPRGVKWQCQLSTPQARGYICENFGAPFKLPELGPIGANGLANPRDFEYPTAHYENSTGEYQLICKFHGHLWQATINHHPLDVVAWHGNYAPYKYNLAHYNTINTVSFDHPDPSIFTVLTSPSNTAGVANMDFVIFPPRWMVAENTFRPPYYHRNFMSEYMGLIYGNYDAKEEGFVPGGSSIHNCMSAHGPDADAFQKATEMELKPQRYKGTLAFMFETCHVWQPTDFALNAATRQKNYLDCWQNLTSHFQDGT